MHEGMLHVIGGIGAARKSRPFNNVYKVYYVKCISGVREVEREPAPLIGRAYRDFRIDRGGLWSRSKGLLSTPDSSQGDSGEMNIGEECNSGILKLGGWVFGGQKKTPLNGGAILMQLSQCSNSFKDFHIDLHD